MRIHVLAEFMLEKFVPQSFTLALRVFDSARRRYRIPRLESPLIEEKRYYFDDIDPVRDGAIEDRELLRDYHIFNETIAGKILRDFRRFYRPSEKQELLVHCHLGQSRSPAIAIALNELFDLGNDTLVLEYNNPNLQVYETLMKKGKGTDKIFGSSLGFII